MEHTSSAKEGSPESSSKLLTLPPEVRLMIYNEVFAGMPLNECGTPAKEPQELLLTSRKVFIEASEQWHRFLRPLEKELPKLWDKASAAWKTARGYEATLKLLQEEILLVRRRIKLYFLLAAARRMMISAARFEIVPVGKLPESREFKEDGLVGG